MRTWNTKNAKETRKNTKARAGFAPYVGETVVCIYSQTGGVTWAVAGLEEGILLVLPTSGSVKFSEQELGEVKLVGITVEMVLNSDKTTGVATTIVVPGKVMDGRATPGEFVR